MDYHEWSARLFDHLVLSAGTDGRPLYLYVDRNDLAEVSNLKPEEAVRDFCEAFNHGLGTARVEPFRHEWLQRRSQEPQGAAPMYFLALVMTVLAVTEPELGGAGGVYPRQNALLGLPALAIAPPGYVDQVPDLWRTWNSWLTGRGSRYGTPTAKTHRTWTHQGWARSQGLFRRADRQLLRRWFDERGEPSERNEAEAAIPHLLTWLAFQADGGGLKGKLRDPAALEVLIDIMLALPDDPDPIPKPRLIRGLVTYDPWRREFGVAFTVPERLEGETISVEGETIELEAGETSRVAENVPGAPLLQSGLTIPVGRHRIRAGGDLFVLMMNEPEIERDIQTYQAQLGCSHSAFVRADVEERILQALRDAGATTLSREVIAPDWVRLTKIRLRGALPDAIREITGLRQDLPPGLRLAGGLQIHPGTYLSWAPPHVLLPSDSAWVELDGQRMTNEGGHVATLPKPLPGGRHTVVSGDDETTFQTADGVRAVPNFGDVGHRFQSLRNRSVLRDAVEDVAEAGTAIRGAEQLPHSMPGRTYIRRFQGGQVFVLTEEGRLFQIEDRAEPWLVQADLVPGCVEAEWIVRGLPGMPAFVIVTPQGPFTPRVRALPRGIAADPGTASHREIGPDKGFLAGASIAHLSTEERRRWSHSVTTRYHGGAKSQQHGAATLPNRARYEMADPADLSHPLDTALAWLSERESPRLGLPAFRRNWQRLGAGISGDLALYFLELLGHVEVDYLLNRVTLAKPTVAVLRRSGGLAVLSGSRPRCLVAALQGETSLPPEAEAASRYWDVHPRAPIRQDAWNITTLFVEWDPDHDEEVLRGLAALGVGVSHDPSDVLLRGYPDLDEYLETCLLLTASPSNRIWAARPGRQWAITHQDAATGFYRYETLVGTQHAWRGTDHRLHRIDHRVGRFLQTRQNPPFGNAKRDLEMKIEIHPKRLLVPRVHPLPPLLARGLVLRSGLLPGERLERPAPGQPAIDYLEYQNVGYSEAELVAGLVGRGFDYVFKTTT